VLPCFSDVGACELHGQIKTASSVHLKLVECKGLGMDSLKNCELGQSKQDSTN